jgi:histidyl-tRNA synthetase
MKGQMKMANANAAKWCVIVGDDELAKGEVQLKDMAAGKQANVARRELIAKLA